MALARTSLAAVVARWASRRRFPVLLALTVALLVVDLAVPDPLPLVDELLLVLGALLLARIRKRDDPSEASDALEESARRGG